MAADPYQLLGVARGASDKEIKSAYRKLAKELHPDRNKDNPKAAERFGDVTRAYDLLADKDKRAQFDRGEIDAEGNPAMPAGFAGGGFQGGGFPGGGFPGGGRAGGFRSESFEGFSGEGGADLGDIFEGLFGGRGGAGFGGGGQRAAPRGASVAYRLSVSLPDAATLAPQRITLEGGATVDLKLPAGVEDGTQMRLAGKGQSGPGGAGDAMVTIHVQPHAFFRRDEDNIRIDLPVALDEAVNGAKVRVPTVDGTVMLTVAPGTSSGRTLRLKGKGFTRRDGTRGDQLVTLEIALPEADADLQARLEGWRDARPLRARFGV